MIPDLLPAPGMLLNSQELKKQALKAINAVEMFPGDADKAKTLATFFEACLQAIKEASPDSFVVEVEETSAPKKARK